MPFGRFRPSTNARENGFIFPKVGNLARLSALSGLPRPFQPIYAPLGLFILGQVPISVPHPAYPTQSGIALMRSMYLLITVVAAQICAATFQCLHQLPDPIKVV